jgi:bifunctional non-homologous end joining protein LigD
LDGTLVLPDAEDAPNVDGRVRAIDTSEWEPVFFAFDLLYRDGQDLRPLALIERKRRLSRLVNRADIGCLHLVQTFEDGTALLAAAQRHGLEGVVSKRRDAPYRSGRCRDWRKVRVVAWHEANPERWRLF